MADSSQHTETQSCARCVTFFQGASSLYFIRNFKYSSSTAPQSSYRIVLSAVEQEAKAGCPSCRIVLKAVVDDAYAFGQNDDLPHETAIYLCREGSDCAEPSSNLTIIYERSESDEGGFVTSSYKQIHAATWMHRVPRDPTDDASTPGVHVTQIEKPTIEMQGSHGDLQMDKLFSMVSEWLAACNTGHEHCRFRTDEESYSFMPTRVIDVGPLDGSRNPKLACLDGKHPYLTLSYCWGGKGFAVTTAENIKDRFDGFPITSLPRTIHDAIIITRKLGFQYLWVDSLCIVQDQRQDWQRESSTMMKVYQNAMCTIVADDSNDADHGMLGTSYESRNNAVTPCQVGEWLLLPAVPEAVSREAGPLIRRKWALQEQLLSRRGLEWSPRRVSWICCFHRANDMQSVLKADTFPEPHFLSATAHRVMRDWAKHVWFGQIIRSQKASTEPHQVWMTIIERFSRRKLTREDDCLPALSGLAHSMMQLVNDTYMAGCWRANLMYYLSWLVVGEYRTKRPEPTSYVAPSWSWASVLSPVHRAALVPERQGILTILAQCDRAEILNIDLELAGPDPCGQLKSGTLRLRGFLAKVPGDFFDNAQVIHYFYAGPRRNLRYLKRGTDTGTDTSTPDPSHDNRCAPRSESNEIEAQHVRFDHQDQDLAANVWFFETRRYDLDVAGRKLCVTEALVLEAVTGTDDPGGSQNRDDQWSVKTFRRIGFASLRPCIPSGLGVSVETIEII